MDDPGIPPKPKKRRPSLRKANPDAAERAASGRSKRRARSRPAAPPAIMLPALPARIVASAAFTPETAVQFVPPAPPVSRVAEPLPRAKSVFRPPRAAGLAAITAAVSCLALATALVLTRMPLSEGGAKSVETARGAVAVAPLTPALQATVLQVPLPQPRPELQPAPARKSSASVRVIGLSEQDTNISCGESVWPYIAPHCIASAAAENAETR